MIIHPAEQNSLEWLNARSGIATASEFGNLLTPKFEPRTGETPKTYLAVKLAEKWLGGPLPGFNSIDMEFGKIREESAIPFYELMYNEPVTRVGLCLTDDGKVGCSPDGLLADKCGLELKSPRAETHVKYVLNDVVPDDYICQVHGAMFVTGRPTWRFMSYHRRFPAFVKLVERDEKIQKAIAEALAVFQQKLDKAFARLVEINGGPPDRPQPSPVPTAAFQDPDDYKV